MRTTEQLLADYAHSIAIKGGDHHEAFRAGVKALLEIVIEHKSAVCPYDVASQTAEYDAFWDGVRAGETIASFRFDKVEAE